MKKLLLAFFYGIKNYISKIKMFSKNASRFIITHFLIQIMLGIFSTIMNVYLLKMGFSKSFIGTYMAYSTIASAVFSVPIGVISDRIGHKKVCIAAALILIVGTVGEVSFLIPGLLLFASFIKGIGSAAFMVVQNPFIMNNSTDKERIHVFSLNHASVCMASVLGSLLAGVLPALAALFINSSGALISIEASSLRTSLAISVIFVVLSIIPVLLIEEKPVTANTAKKGFRIKDVIHNKNILSLTFHRFLIGVGAGFTLPFFNVFLSDSFNATNEEISMITMGSRIVLTIGTLLSPLLLKKFGRMKSIIITQVLSIPTLVAITWSPNVAAVALLYWVRTALMNMSSPISNSMAMELVPDDLRSTSSSMIHMADSVGRSAAQIGGGWIMDNLSNVMPYYITGILYVLATAFFWSMFKNVDKGGNPAEA
ncbi:MFS transporter [Tyzzerella sp. OttesenSCG-928-J15]|nr:MFS transporter [Tyzzerella sp. OttesenSCG-928-J15]